MDMAANMGGQILGQTMNMAFSGMQDKRQLKQQKLLNQDQEERNARQAKLSKDLQMQMWHDTNYGAQIKEAKDAGMSISALYGGSGGGGSTTGSANAAGVSGAHAGDPNAGVANGMMMASQLALQKAQKENIEADTANKQAGTENTKEQTGVTKVAGQVARNTVDAQIQKIEKDAQQSFEDAEQKFLNRMITQDTWQDQVKGIKARAIGDLLENELTKSKTNVNYAEIRKMQEQISQGWEGLRQGRSTLDINTFRAEMEKNYPGIMNVLGKTANDAVTSLYKIATMDMNAEQNMNHKIKK